MFPVYFYGIVPQHLLDEFCDPEDGEDDIDPGTPKPLKEHAHQFTARTPPKLLH